MFLGIRMYINSCTVNEINKRPDNIVGSSYPEPGSNRHGHYWPQDFKSGVSTYSTIRATQPY